MIATLWWASIAVKVFEIAELRMNDRWTQAAAAAAAVATALIFLQIWYTQIGAFDAHFDCTATSINSENTCGHLLRMLLLFQFSCLLVDNWKIHWSDSWHRKMNGHKTRNTKPNWLCLAITNCLYGIKHSETNQGI